MKKIKSVKKYEVGGVKTEQCDPIRGCGHKRAQKANKRRAAANAAGPVLKKIGTAVGAAVAGAFAFKNKDKIKEKLGIEKNGGSVKKMKSGGSMTRRKK